MEDSDGFHLASIRRDGTDADQRAGDVVDADGRAVPAARGPGDLDGLAVHERDGRPLVEGDRAPARQRRLRPRDACPERGRVGADHVGPGDRVGKAEGADTTPDEPLDGATVAERRPEVGGEHAYVGALAADDTEGGSRRSDLFDRDRMDDDLPGRAVDLDPLARQLVEPAPFVVNRRVHGRDLLDPADERPARLLELASLEPGDHDLREDAPSDIVGVGREPEADHRDVLLVVVHEVRRELGGLADQDRQDARRGRVERTGMADPADAESPAEERDDVERRHPRALVDDEHARAADPDAHLASPPVPGAAASAARAAASTTRVASASGFASVHPAAFGWPPPPNSAAIRCTSTSPLPRRLTFTWPSRSRKRHATRTVATERG